MRSRELVDLFFALGARRPQSMPPVADADDFFNHNGGGVRRRACRGAVWGGALNGTGTGTGAGTGAGAGAGPGTGGMKRCTHHQDADFFTLFERRHPASEAPL